MTTPAINKTPEGEGFTNLPTAAEAAVMLEKPNETNATKEIEVPEVAEKFKGKTVEQVVEMYTNLEQQSGRQAQELGSLRGSVDQLLTQKRTDDLLANGGQPTPDPVTADELLSDPESAINRIAEHAVKPSEDRLNQLESQIAQNAFTGRHPTFQTDMEDPKFQDYVQKSPYRSTLATKTLQGDMTAAEELWSGYDDVRESGDGTDGSKGEIDEATKATLKAAETVTAGAGHSDGDLKPIYSRAKIIEMKMTNPEAYENKAFQDILIQAYRDKRVR